jgi:hypothetical protein
MYDIFVNLTGINRTPVYFEHRGRNWSRVGSIYTGLAVYRVSSINLLLVRFRRSHYRTMLLPLKS